MSRSLLQLVLRQAEGLVANREVESDSDLLQRFVRAREETAFVELLRRHGPMVWAVCRHRLSDESDAEDAFQATFLALVRSASSVRNGNAVAAWLHGVAVKVATKAKRSAVRRRQREERVAGSEADRSVPEAAWDELLFAVHEEVQRLPDALRTAFVLCELEGVRQPEAAARLGWKPGTLTGRLTRARQLLLARLTSRGLAPALAGGTLSLGVVTAKATMPNTLSDKALILWNAGEAVSPAILNLVREVIPMMAIRTKLAAAAIVMAGGLGAVFFPLANAQQPGGGGGPLGGSPPGLSNGPPGGSPPGLSNGPPGGSPPGLSNRFPQPVFVPADPEGPRGNDPSIGLTPGSAMGGVPAVAIGRAQWEYKFVPEGSNDNFVKLFTDLGNDGWEFCGPMPPPKLANLIGNNSGTTLIFKRLKGVANRAPGGGPGPGSSGPKAGPSMGPGGPMGPGGSAAGPTSVGPGAPPAGNAGHPLTILTLKHAVAAELSTLIERLFPSLTVAVDPRSNALILRADEATLKAVKVLIEQLDVPSKKPINEPVKP